MVCRKWFSVLTSGSSYQTLLALYPRFWQLLLDLTPDDTVTNVGLLIDYGDFVDGTVSKTFGSSLRWTSCGTKRLCHGASESERHHWLTGQLAPVPARITRTMVP
ncbi:hypothetical protein EDB86DRAFT_2893412 [Lactarius hatsudake]|nr:hypothetical protein EDB86DRAFT_2893412 [Lactarius hatsudake]